METLKEYQEALKCLTLEKTALENQNGWVNNQNSQLVSSLLAVFFNVLTSSLLQRQNWTDEMEANSSLGAMV